LKKGKDITRKKRDSKRDRKKETEGYKWKEKRRAASIIGSFTEDLTSPSTAERN
jgi:hypothetical protein